MGVTASYLGYRFQKQSLTPHGDFPQQLQEGYSLPLILDNGIADSPQMSNLLQAQLLALRAAIERTHKEIGEINDKLGKAKDAIIALTTLNAPIPRSQSISTSSSNCSDLLPKSEAVSEDLIDLLDFSQDSSHVEALDEDTTLLDSYSEDDSEVEGLLKNVNRDPIIPQSSYSEFESSSYIVHFTDSDEDDSQGDAIKKVQVPSDTRTSCSSSSNATSTSTSPSLTSSNSQPLKDVHANVVNEAFSQLKVLDSEGGDLDKAIAIVSRLAGEVSGSEAEPSQPTAKAPKKGQDLQDSTGDYFIEPRWSPQRSLDSSRDRATAALINRRSTRAGARDVPCPGFFKHGIHFVPRPTEHDFYRTVIISGLPLSITMEALLNKVRGGVLIDAKLLNTAKLMGSNTALVTFLHEHPALAFEDHAKKYPIIFSNFFAQVAVIPTPTFPISIDLRTSIEEARTRCLEIHGLPPNISAKFKTRAHQFACHEINQPRVHEAES